MIVLEWMPVLLLIPLPWLLRAIIPRAHNADSQALNVPFFKHINELTEERQQGPERRHWLFRFLLVIIWFLLIIAAAGPQYIGKPVNLTSKARDLLLAVDVSESMRAKDLQLAGEQVDRLSVVKNVLKDFISKRSGDRLGLILFGSQAYLQTPLTFDHKTLQQLLNEAQIGIAGPKTAIGDAIGLALKRLKDRPNQSKVLILLTDGANTAGEIQPVQAAELAARKGLKIYTIGVGSDEMVIPGIFGSRLGARRVNPSADLDEATLNSIAELTGGRYFRAKTSESLRHIYELVDQLEPIEATPETFRPTKALFYYPLGLAFLISALLTLQTLASHTSLKDFRANRGGTAKS